MIQLFTNQRYARQAIIFGALALAIYLIMILITLAQIEALSSLVAFDMRPGGYSVSQANELLVALGTKGRRYYLTRQIPLDLAYPALMALTLVSTLRWLNLKGTTDWLVKMGVYLSIAAALADYLENIGIALMLANGPNPPVLLIHAASFSSITKASLTSIAVILLILCAAQAFYRKIKP